VNVSHNEEHYGMPRLPVDVLAWKNPALAGARIARDTFNSFASMLVGNNLAFYPCETQLPTKDNFAMNSILKLQALQTDAQDRNNNPSLISAISVLCPAEGVPID
jgi:hypothetical protein